MYYKQSFEDMPEDMLLHGKLTNDGGHNLFQRDSPPSRRKKLRKKYVDREVEVDGSLFENAKSAVETKEAKKNEETEKSDHSPDENPLTASPINSVNSQTARKSFTETQQTLDKPNQTQKMPFRKLFDRLYDTWLSVKWAKRRKMLISTLMPYLDNDYKRTVAFVDENLERRRHNTGSRFRRAKNKCNLNRFNFFVTFTFDSAKMDGATFYKKLRAYLKNKVNRSGWKYYGVWEGGDGQKRLHFHALMYIPDGTMPGNPVKDKRYNTSKHKLKETVGNTEFNEKFGRSDVQEIIEPMKEQAYQYVLKYLNKGGKTMVSKNCPEHISGWVAKRDLLGEMTEIENKFVAMPDCQIAVDGTGEIITVDERKPQEALRKIQDSG
ncbi:MAG: hypothetical protein ACI4RO_03830 [Candidatus Scatosoma sp.]